MRENLMVRARTMGTQLCMLAALALPFSLVGCGEGPCGAELSFSLEGDCDGDFVTDPFGFPTAPEHIEEDVVAARALTPGTTVRGWTSSRALGVYKTRLFVVDRDNDRLVVLNRETGGEVAIYDVGDRPHHVIVDPDANAWVTVRNDGAIVKVTRDGELSRKVIGGGPTSLALSHDRNILYVSLTESGRVIALDPNTLEEQGSVSISRPRAVVTSAGGDVHVASGNGTVVLAPKVVDESLRLTVKTRVDLRVRNPLEQFFAEPDRPSAANGALAGVLDPETDTALITHQLIFPGNRETALQDAQPQRAIRGRDTSYGGSGGDVFVPVPPRPAEVTVSRSGDAPDRRGSAPSFNGFPVLAASPLDINHHPTHSIAAVVANGTSEVLFLNTRMEDPFSAPLGVVAVGEGPTAVAFSPEGDMAYVLCAHEFVVQEVPLDTLLARAEDHTAKNARLAELHAPQRLDYVSAFPYGTDPLSESAALGRRIFTQNRYDGLSGEGSFACQTCHIEGTEDGAVWFGRIGPRQTPSLAGRLHDTAPFNWRGSEVVLQDNFTRTVARMGGFGLQGRELRALERFIVEELAAPRNPYAGRELTPQQARGKALYHDPVVGCAGCHSGSALTDGKAHDVGTLTQLEISLDKLGAFADEDTSAGLGVYDTPSLRDVYRTAPYFHDGSAATLEEALDMTATTMGRTDHLDQAQKADLIAYLKTL